MKISPVKNRSKVITVNEAIGRLLLSKGKFVLADAPKVIEPEIPGVTAGLDEGHGEEVEISPRTGLPKRVYRRRDMESE